MTRLKNIISRDFMFCKNQKHEERETNLKNPRFE